MGLLTEAELRLRLRGAELDSLGEYRVEPGTIVTPSARTFLTDHKIALRVGGEPEERAEEKVAVEPKLPRDDRNGNLPVFEKPGRYVGPGGGYYDEKPEHLTALRGMTLVEKDHPVIRFRGAVDCMEAEVVAARVALERAGHGRLAEDLGEVLAYLREILRCEVLELPLTDRPLLGMDEGEIRQRSHTPQKYYGLRHFAVGPEHGEAVALLNRLRAEVRRVELDAYRAFRGVSGVPEREDLIRALNRLSSLFYVMMFRVLAGEYKPQGHAAKE